jgi:hypothetical protein
LRFHKPLRAVRLISPDAASQAAAAEKPARRLEPEAPPKPATPPPPPAQAPTQPPAPPQADLERELRADRARIEAVLGGVTTAVADLRRDRAGRIEQWQKAAIELAATIASRILHERIVTGEFPIEAKVRDMIAQLGDDAAVAVRLNPLDLDLLTARVGRSGDDSLLTGPGAPRFVADSALNRGECQVEGRESMLLSDVTRELQDIREELIRSLDNARP